MSTACQLGIHKTRGVPSLLDSILPPGETWCDAPGALQSVPCGAVSALRLDALLLLLQAFRRLRVVGTTQQGRVQPSISQEGMAHSGSNLRKQVAYSGCSQA